MKKKYEHSKENNETSNIREPAITYNTLFERKTQFINLINEMSPREFEHLEVIYYADRYPRELNPLTVEQIREQARRAVEDVKAGRIIDHEEMKKRFRK